MEELFDELKETECPFLWKINPVYVEQNLTDKMLSNIDDQTEDGCNLQNFAYLIAAMYDTAVIKKDMSSAEEMLWKYDFLYDKLIEDDVMKDYAQAFKHILFSATAYFSCYAKKYDSYKQLLKEIPLISEFDAISKAGLYGTKASVLFQFGPFESTILGCELSKKAIQLDPDQGEWHFLYGKGLHRQRRIEKRNCLSSIDEIAILTGEMKHLELSLDLSPSPSKKVFLAESYADAVNMIFHQKKGVPDKFDRKYDIFHKMGNRAVELYNDAATNHDKSWYILLRCGMGFLKLEPPFKNYTLAEKYLEKAYDLKPDSGFICHQLSVVYARTKKTRRSFEFAKKAANLGIVLAVLDEIRQGKILSRDHDVLHSLERNYLNFNPHGRSIISLHKASYYIFKKDWDAGLLSFLDAFELCDKKMLPHFKFHAPSTNLNRYKYTSYSAIVFIDHLLKEIERRGIPVNDNVVLQLNSILCKNYSEALTETKSLPVVQNLMYRIFED